MGQPFQVALCCSYGKERKIYPLASRHQERIRVDVRFAGELKKTQNGFIRNSCLISDCNLIKNRKNGVTNDVFRPGSLRQT